MKIAGFRLRMEQRWMRGIAKVALTALLPLASQTLADTDPQATGLPEFTPAELEYQNKNHSRVKEVKLNALGLVRVNSDRLRKGNKQLTAQDVQLARLGEDLVTTEPGAPAPKVTDSTAAPSATPLPPYVDNSLLKYFPPIRSQGSLLSCGPFSGTYYTMTYMNALARDLDAKSDSANQLSPKWTFNMLNGGQNTGSWYYRAYEIGIKHGSATWLQFPYDANYRAWCLDGSVWQDAISRRFDTYGYVADTHLDSGIAQVKQMLANGYILNFATYINSWQWKTVGNDPSTTADDAFAGKTCAFWVNGKENYHAMTVVGFNDNIWVDINGNGVVEPAEKGAFRIANSWGTGWREAGFGWMSYDALKTTTAVSGGPSTGRISGWSPTRAHWVTALPYYTPLLLAQFTVNHAARNQMQLSLGISDLTQTTPATTWFPAALFAQGGAYAFDGSTTPVDGTFVLDFSDLAPSGTSDKRFYLNVTDSVTGSATTLKSFALIDLAADGASASSADAPAVVDGGTLNPSVDYTFSDGNLPPVADFTVSTATDYAPVNAYFDAGSSTDEDGAVAGYDWDFGDGTTGSGISAQHTYASAGTYQVTLTVTDDWGASDSAVATLVVSRDPNLALHVSGITMVVSSTKSGRAATARVNVVDASGAACTGATVTGSWTGVVAGSSSGTTITGGTATLTSPRTKNSGAFTFTVTGIVKSGYLYNATANTASAASIQ